jgi:mono/diheme cytochrome c family protein
MRVPWGLSGSTFASRGSAIRCAFGAAVCAWVMVGWFSIAGDARQVRSVAVGVYSAAQATRAQALYKDQCASCHGAAGEGTIGPPVAGDIFLTAWSGRPVAELVDKIQKTMPFNLPGSLSRPQSIDLATYILQVGKFPAGQAELTDAQLAQVTFPARAAASAAAATGGTTALVAPVGNLAELMRAIAFPSANIIFQLQVKDPTDEKPGPAPVPFDYVKWGATIYPGWLAVDQAALAIAESAPLLLTPGRRCQNGRPAPIDRADYKQYVADLVAIGKEAYAASKARKFEAFVEISDKLNTACANCHMVYRDKGGTEGSGATRCQ